VSFDSFIGHTLHTHTHTHTQKRKLHVVACEVVKADEEDEDEGGLHTHEVKACLLSVITW
jgi:hypothetical protein